VSNSIKSISEAYTSMLINERYSMDKKPNIEKDGNKEIESYNVYYKNKLVGSVVKIKDDYWASGSDIGSSDRYFSDNHRTKEDAYKALVKQKPHKDL